MLGSRFRSHRRLQQGSNRNAVGGTDVDDSRGAIGQSSRFVEKNRIDGRERFQVQPPFDDRAELRGTSNPAQNRSEEHTSELQSLTNLVCRLLLEKKKSNTTTVDI